MKKIREIISTAATAEGLAASRIKREEKENPDMRIVVQMVTSAGVKITGMICVLLLVLRANVWNLIAFSFFGLLFFLIYNGFKN